MCFFLGHIIWSSAKLHSTSRKAVDGQTALIGSCCLSHVNGAESCMIMRKSALPGALMSHSLCVQLAWALTCGSWQRRRCLER